MEQDINIIPTSEAASQTPTQLPPTSKHNSSKLQWLFISALIGVASYFAYQNWQLKQQITRITPIQNDLTIATPTQKANPTETWTVHTDSVLGISYKLPPKLGRLETSGKEIPAERGTQYCVIYVGSLSFSIPQKVYAGSGACGGGVFGIGTVSKNYEAGREGGFGDFTGYTKQNGTFFLRFINTVSQSPLSQDVATEKTNDHGVTYLRIQGKNKLYDRGGEMMDGPVYGTPGKGYLGAIINNSNSGSAYAGFNIQMEVKTPTDELIFDQILSTIMFTKSPSSNRTTPQTISGWRTYTNTTPPYSIRYPSDWTIDTSKAKQNEETGAQLTIAKGAYTLVITWPTGYGPGVCIFSDNPLFGKEKEGPIGDCVGNFIEFQSSTSVFRRLEKPDLIPRETPTDARWSVYTKDSGGSFVTVPPIQYTAPKIYDEKMIKTMDQILASYTSGN